MSARFNESSRLSRSLLLPVGEKVGMRGGCSPQSAFPSPLRGEGRVRGGCSPHTFLRKRQSGSVRLPAAGLLLFACPRTRLERVRTAKLARRAEGRMPGVKKSSQEKRHPATARGGHPARRVPCGARRQQAAKQLGRPWPRTVWLSPAAGPAPRRRRGAPVQGAAILAAFGQDQMQEQERAQRALRCGRFA